MGPGGGGGGGGAAGVVVVAAAALGEAGDECACAAVVATDPMALPKAGVMARPSRSVVAGAGVRASLHFCQAEKASPALEAAATAAVVGLVAAAEPPACGGLAVLARRQRLNMAVLVVVLVVLLVVVVVVDDERRACMFVERGAGRRKRVLSRLEGLFGCVFRCCARCARRINESAVAVVSRRGRVVDDCV